MSADDLKRWLKRAPFRPFRLIILESAKFDVYHPEAIYFQVASFDFFPHTTKPLTFSDEGSTISLRHITRIEPLPFP